MNIELPIPLTITLYVLFGAAAVAAVIFNRQLKQVPEFVETVVHEVSHSLAAIATGGTLPLRITFRKNAEAEIFSLTTTSSRFSHMMMGFGGYLGPVLIGPILIVFTLTPIVKVPIMLLALIGVFVALATIFIFFPTARAILTLLFYILLATVLIAPPELMSGGTISGVGAATACAVTIYIFMIFGSWTHLFTLLRVDSLRSLGVLFLLTVTMAGLFFLPFLAAPALFGLGLFLTLSGWRTILVHRHHGGDFGILSEELGGSSKGWFVFFCGFLPIALLVVARLLWVLIG